MHHLVCVLITKHQKWRIFPQIYKTDHIETIRKFNNFWCFTNSNNWFESKLIFFSQQTSVNNAAKTTKLILLNLLLKGTKWIEIDFLNLNISLSRKIHFKNRLKTFWFFNMLENYQKNSIWFDRYNNLLTTMIWKIIRNILSSKSDEIIKIVLVFEKGCFEIEHLYTTLIYPYLKLPSNFGMCGWLGLSYQHVCQVWNNRTADHTNNTILSYYTHTTF